MLPNSTERAVTVSGASEAVIQCIFHICTIMSEVSTLDDDDDDDDENGDDDDDDADDIYIMMHVCLFVTKNDHFLLGVSCNHLNPP